MNSKRRTYLLLLPEGNVQALLEASGVLRGPSVFDEILNRGDQLYAFGESSAFIRSEISIEAIANHLRRKGFEKSSFFLADVSDADRGGNMVPRFWEFLREEDRITAE